MALEKSFDTNFGIPAIYWNIGLLEENFAERYLRVVLYGYVNEAAWRGGGRTIKTITLVFDKPEDYIPNPTREQVYGLVKAHEVFVDAVDLLEA